MAIEAVQEKTIVNLEALSKTLRSELNDLYLGLSTGTGKVTVYLRDETTEAQQALAHDIIMKHDPEQLTLEQQAKLDFQNSLISLRVLYGNQPIELKTYENQSTLIQQLAYKVAWLEAELLNLLS